MFKVSRTEAVMAAIGTLVALLSWPIGLSVGSVGKVLITAGALSALLVTIISIFLDHDSMDEVAIGVFRKLVAYFLGFAVFAVIMLIITLD